MIKFGTDGWRDIIADEFNFENVRRVAQAVSDHVKADCHRGGNPRLVVGYDTRFLSDEFARQAALVAVANGIEVFLTESFAPTPAVSFSVVDKKADGAILITASHNPPCYNGFKFKAPYGGSATPDITEKIERHYRKNLTRGKMPSMIPLEEAVGSGRLHFFDPKEAYLSHIFNLLNKDLFHQPSTVDHRPKIIVDPMYGAGQGYLSQALSCLGCYVEEIHNEINPSFGGVNPEPISENLGALRDKVTEGNFDVGLAMDGDADRIGAIDARGGFINSHQIFALLLEHLVGCRGWRGDVVKTVSSTRMIDSLTQKYDLKLLETPVGFKYICEHILSGDVLIGGEESGGIGIKNHIPERDGILVGLLLVEMMVTHGKTLGELVDDLMRRVGYFYYNRVDMDIDPSSKERISAHLEALELTELVNTKVVAVNDVDGYKFCLDDGGWLMIRPSGTEAVVRIYAEADSPQKVSLLLKKGQEIVSAAARNVKNIPRKTKKGAMVDERH